MLNEFRSKRIAGLLERPVVSKLQVFSVVGKVKYISYVLSGKDLKVNERLKKRIGVSEWIRRKDKIMPLVQSREIIEEESTVKISPLMEWTEMQNRSCQGNSEFHVVLCFLCFLVLMHKETQR